MIITVYNAQGELGRQCEAPDFLIASQLKPGENFIEGAYIAETQYIPDILNPAVVDKFPNPITVDVTEVLADGQEAITISNIPTIEDAVITISGEGVELEQVLLSPQDTITFDTPGTYLLSVKTFSFREFQKVVYAS